LWQRAGDRRLIATTIRFASHGGGPAEPSGSYARAGRTFSVKRLRLVRSLATSAKLRIA
jgi:hypothetical protein